jgi:hypothetical protein
MIVDGGLGESAKYLFESGGRNAGQLVALEWWLVAVDDQNSNFSLVR